MEDDTECTLECSMDAVKVFLLFPFSNERSLSFL